MSIALKKYQPEFLEGVKNLYEELASDNPNVIFWWPGEAEFTWDFCWCAFDGDKLVGKGQVQPVTVMEEGMDPEGKHQIYVNIKILTEYEEQVFDSLYEIMYEKALVVKGHLPKGFGANLCVGNMADEKVNNALYEAKGFEPFRYMYWMTNKLNGDIPVQSAEEAEIAFWKMESEQDEKTYLAWEEQIWPTAPLSIDRLREYKKNELWTAITARIQGEPAGCLMCWKEWEDGAYTGMIEDVFVLPEYRNKGIARALLTHALHYCKENGLEYSSLAVTTSNASALSLYKSVGFEVKKEEIRYSLDL